MKITNKTGSSAEFSESDLSDWNNYKKQVKPLNSKDSGSEDEVSIDETEFEPKFSETDLTDWNNFTKQVKPLNSKGSDSKDEVSTEATGFEPKFSSEFSKQSGADSFAPRRPNRPRPLRQIPKSLLKIEEKLLKKLKNRELRIDDHVDLHGYRQQEARRVLQQFLRNAQIRRYKIVLVITGKGDSRRDEFGMSETGVLRQELPRWLIQSDFYRLVAASSIAYPCHGGEGARYIQIRRPR